MNDEQLQARYGQSDLGNFEVRGTISVPHPFCVTARHVELASDHFSGRLGTEAIQEAERRGIYCGICKGKLTYAEHETALLVYCKIDLDGKPGSELHTYLNRIKPLCEEDKYAGFAFKKI